MVDGIPVIDLTAPGLLGLAVLLLFAGRLVPRSTLNDKAQEAERWRLAYEAEREARVELSVQTTELIELARTTNRVIVSVFSSHILLPKVGGSDEASETQEEN